MLTKNKSYFLDFPDDARLWVFMSEKAFSTSDIQLVSEELSTFLSHWNAHGNAIKGQVEVIDNQFIVVVADEHIAAASGCSIDSMVECVKKIESRLDKSLTNRMLMAYCPQDKIEVLPFLQLKKMYKNGELPPETSVYNNSVSNLGDFRAQWETTLGELF